MSLTDEQRRVLAAAKDLEQQRIEVYARAVEENVADLLPESFSNFDMQMEDPVDVYLTLGLTAKEADRLSDRECRRLVRWFGERADDARVHRSLQDD